MEFVEVNDKFIKLIQEIVRDTIVKVMQQPQADSNNGIYSTTQVAKILNVKPTTVTKRIREGKLVATKKGKSYIITEDNLTTYINDN